MVEIKFELPGPGTAAFITTAVATYASFALKQVHALFWAVLAVAFLSLAVGLVVEYSHIITDPNRSGQQHKKEIHILLYFAYFAKALTVLCFVMAALALAFPWIY